MDKFWKGFWVLIVGSVILSLIQGALDVKFVSIWQQMGYDIPHMIWGYFILSFVSKNINKNGEIK